MAVVFVLCGTEFCSTLVDECLLNSSMTGSTVLSVLVILFVSYLDHSIALWRE
mgnify:FL=1